MNIMSIFSNPNKQQAAPAPTANADTPLHHANSGAPSGASPAGEGAASPLDGYKDLWQTPAPAAGSNVPSPLELDQSKLSEVVSKANFAAGIDNELVRKATSGDAEAFASVLNHVSRAAFTQALTASSTLTRQALEMERASTTEKLPSMVRSSLVRQEMASSPLYQHEATRPVLAALEAQLSAKYPTASAAEIRQHAQTYIDEMVRVAGGGKKDPAGPKLPDDQDFSEWDNN